MTWRWVLDETRGARSVVDLGAGRFEYFDHVAPSVVEKIGVEIFERYLVNARHDQVAIHGDMREWKRLVPEHARDVAMMIDTLEHIPKEDGERMLAELVSEFRKVLVFTPLGFMHQDHLDVWDGDNVYQDHLSGWTSEDLQAFGFKTREEPTYHNGKGGAIFAIYERSE